MRHPIIQYRKNRVLLDCDPTLDREKAFKRLEDILKDLLIRFYSPKDDLTGHDGTYYNGTLYASIRPKNPISQNAYYWDVMLFWDVDIAPTSNHTLNAAIDVKKLSKEIPLYAERSEIIWSGEKAEIYFKGHTINIFYSRSLLDRQYWHIDSKQDWVEIDRLFS